MADLQRSVMNAFKQAVHIRDHRRTICLDCLVLDHLTPCCSVCLPIRANAYCVMLPSTNDSDSCVIYTKKHSDKILEITYFAIFRTLPQSMAGHFPRDWLCRSIHALGEERTYDALECNPEERLEHLFPGEREVAFLHQVSLDVFSYCGCSLQTREIMNVSHPM